MGPGRWTHPTCGGFWKEFHSLHLEEIFRAILPQIEGGYVTYSTVVVVGDARTVREGVAPNLGNFWMSEIAQILYGFCWTRSKEYTPNFAKIWRYFGPSNISSPTTTMHKFLCNTHQLLTMNTSNEHPINPSNLATKGFYTIKLANLTMPS